MSLYIYDVLNPNPTDKYPRDKSSLPAKSDLVLLLQNKNLESHRHPKNYFFYRTVKQTNPQTLGWGLDGLQIYIITRPCPLHRKHYFLLSLEIIAGN